MGYEIHVSRTEEHYDSAENPIELEDWLSYADASPSLSVGGWLGWDEDRQPIYLHTCADDSVVSLTWFEGGIDIKGYFSSDPYRKFGSLAENFGATIHGDDGGRYTATGVLPPSH
ncbi:hypothetical protein [Micromonospora sp. CPCC 205558]|uniref:hypothetical protein n=1 Tax=Micromonospora sp. CPCC 205558 TaxID=3122403 RepID=UPI002FEE7FB1